MGFLSHETDDDDDDGLLPTELLFVQSFLQTFKREWTGIDRLRMDKFFQVRGAAFLLQRFERLRLFPVLL